MLEVSLLTEDTVDASHHFVPFIVVPVSTSTVYQRTEIRIVLKHCNSNSIDTKVKQILASLESHSPSLLALSPKICPKTCSSISGLLSACRIKKGMGFKFKHTVQVEYHTGLKTYPARNWNCPIPHDMQILVDDGKPEGKQNHGISNCLIATYLVYDWMQLLITCSLMKWKPRSSLRHSNVSPRTGLKGL